MTLGLFGGGGKVKGKPCLVSSIGLDVISLKFPSEPLGEAVIIHSRFSIGNGLKQEARQEIKSQDAVIFWRRNDSVSN